MKQPFILLFGVVALIAIGSLFTYPTGDDTFPPTSPASSAEVELTTIKGHVVPVLPNELTQGKTSHTEAKALANLRKDLTRLRKEVAALKRNIEDHWHTETVAASWAGDEEGADTASKDLAARAQEEEDRLKEMEVLEADFLQEPINSEWSFESVTAVEDMLADNEPMSTAIKGIECRSSTCRIDIEDDDTGELHNILPLFIHELPETLSNVRVSRIGEDEKSMILYMSHQANEPE